MSSLKSNINVHHSKIEENSSEFHSQKEIIRDEIFRRFDKPFGLEQHQFNRIWFVTNIAAIFYMGYLILTRQISGSHILFFEVPLAYVGGLGLTVGAHRLWTHRTFKANLPLKLILMICQTTTFQYPLHKWCLDHRIHHKFVDTEADPHNSKKGFWFSQLLWLAKPKTKELQEKLKTFEVPDLESDPVIRFQSRWYWELLLVSHFLLPIYILHTLWGFSVYFGLVSCMARHGTSINVTGLVNSVAHIWGDKPFDKNLTAVDNSVVSLLAIGEGWHNYHHTFPWDYKAAEFGWKINLSTIVIDFFASIGWAWDLKTVPPNMLKDRIERTGDGFILSINPKGNSEKLESSDCVDENKMYWGWDDDTIPNDLRQITKVLLPDSK